MHTKLTFGILAVAVLCARRWRRALGVASGALLLVGFTSDGPSPTPASAARCWIAGDVEGALAALEAAPANRERDLDRAIVHLYAGESALAKTEILALQKREPRWPPALRWLARAEDQLDRPEAIDAVSILPAGLGADAAEAVPAGLHPGETLRYQVKYLFLNLAHLTLETGNRILYKERSAHQVTFTAKSNPGIPFFHIDSHFESLVGDDGAVLAHRHVASDSDTGDDQAGYDMDREAHHCTVRTARDGVFGYDILSLPPNAQDGVSVLLVARALARARGAADVPTAVDSKWWTTQLRTLGTERIRWCDRDVVTVHVQSTGHYRGPGGLSGTIDLWVSDDDRALPVRVRMKVAVGSVVLELLPEESAAPAAGGASASSRGSS